MTPAAPPKPDKAKERRGGVPNAYGLTLKALRARHRRAQAQPPRAPGRRA